MEFEKGEGHAGGHGRKEGNQLHLVEGCFPYMTSLPPPSLLEQEAFASPFYR